MITWNRWLILCLALLAVRVNVFAAGDAAGLLNADRAFFHMKDWQGQAKLLDPDFSWTTAGGRVLTVGDFIRSGGGPVPALGSAVSRADTVRKTHIYGEIGTIEENIGRTYVLQVWVKRAEGWRLLVYHEVQAQPAPLAAGAEASAAPDCTNPCKEVPFKPANQTEREIIESYQAVERAVTAHDAQAWGSHIADEFFAVTSNSDKPLDKASRMAGLANQKQGGIAPFPLLSARMFAFGDTVVMASKQQPVNGPPLRVTRVWVRRDGRWVESISYQTTVKPK